MEECVDDLVIHRRAHRLPADRSIRHAIAVLRRVGRVRDQMALAVVDQEVEKKLRGFLHDGIGFARQECAIQTILIVLPEMERQPRAAHRPDADVAVIDGRGIGPGIDIVMEREAAGAVHFLGCAPATVE